MTLRTALLASSVITAFNGGYSPQPKDIEMIRANAQKAGGVTVESELTKRSADSAYMLDYWELAEAIMRGLKGMVEAGTKYLPKFADEEDKDYQERLRFTKMTNVFRDNVESLSSKPFEQEVTLVAPDGVTVPEELEQFVENVDGSGSNLTQFAGATMLKGIAYCIDWIMVDYPKTEKIIRSVAELKAANLRPYWSHVLGSNVFDVRSKVVNGKETLTYIKIFEPGEPCRFREFERLDTGVIVWRTHTKSKESGEYLPEDEGKLTIDQIPLEPFFTGIRDGRSWRFDAAMQSAADLQKDLYQQESALKFAKNLTAYPMLAGNGVNPPKGPDGKPAKLAVGPKRVLYSPPDGNGKSGTWTYVEPSAQSLKFLADEVKETIQQLRELGKQPLTAQSGNLTVITTAVAAGKAASAVSQWALTLKNALENAFVITCKYMNIKPETYDPEVYVYSDFDDFTDGKDLEALRGARQDGDLSQSTYWGELKRRKVLAGDFNPEEEAARLLKEVPTDDRNLDEGQPGGRRQQQEEDEQ